MSKPKLNQPDVESTITSPIGESLNINFTIPSKQFEQVFEKDTNIEKRNLTLEEVKKEWEEEGFEVICSKERFEAYKQWIERHQKVSHHTSAKVVIEKDFFYIVGKFSNEYTHLLIKTFKAMRLFDE